MTPLRVKGKGVGENIYTLAKTLTLAKGEGFSKGRVGVKVQTP